MVTQIDQAPTLIRVFVAIPLAIILLVSAGAKLLDLDGSRQSLTAMGVPAPNVSVFLVPAAEVVVAVMLVTTPLAGGIAAFGLLAAFTTVLLSLYRSGSTVSCNCFGSLSKGAVSRLELARNGLMLAMAAMVVVTA